MRLLIAGLLSALLAGLTSRCHAGTPSDIPPGYLAAVHDQQASRFCANDIKSFVHHVFALYDKHADVSKFLPLLADKGLDMRFPEATLRSHQDFKRWYAGIGNDIRSNTHQVERINVTFIGRGKYQADIIVLWQALTKDGRFLSMHVQQTWTLDDGKNGRWPRILSYVVKELPAPARTRG